MSASPGTVGGAAGKGWSAWVSTAMVACVAGFVWAVAQFYEPQTGFSSLIMIGDLSNPKVTALQQAPHFVYENSWGYDGAYYVQLALNPTLDNPELAKSIDNLPYRARRMLFCWLAWVLGLGQPAWIIQAHALINVGCWLALAAVLLRWFPPTNAQNLIRWLAIIFSHGLCMSVRRSLVDGPSLLLVAVAMAWLERGRPGRATGMLALAGLGKETNLLAMAGFMGRVEGGDPEVTGFRWWLKRMMRVGMIALPLLVWIGLLRWKFGKANDPGLGNFTIPFAGLAEQWREALANLLTRPEKDISWMTACATLAVTVQFLFLAFRRRPQEVWWRVGAAFAVMMIFLSKPVWEGDPGAFTRVLLPMTLAFNILVPRGRAWLPVLIAGNLSVIAGLHENNPPARDFLRVKVESARAADVRVTAAASWYGSESSMGVRWRWSSGDAVLQVDNRSGGLVSLTGRGRAESARDERRLQISAGQMVVWSGALSREPVEFRFECTAPPGLSALTFASDQPPHHLGEDTRLLAFKISNLEIVAAPAPAQR